MTEGPRKYNFGVSKSSGLSAIANKIWTNSKEAFGDQKDKPVVLERKALSDVLDKIKKDQGPAITESADSSAPAFVFGQGLSDRVLQPTHTSTSSSADAGKTAENLFKSAAAAEKRTTLGDNDGTNGSTATTAEKLRDAAEQYSKDHEKDNIASTSVPVDVKTGEENDATIHQFSCKIHSFEAGKKQWVERGLSSFKINQIGATADSDGWTTSEAGSDNNFRIVARTFGTMKLIINSPVFADMVIEKVDERRVKITAVGAEGGAPQIFLLTSNVAKTDSIGEIMFVALKDAREKVKRAEAAAGSRKRKAESSQESVPEPKKVIEDKSEEREEVEEAAAAADAAESAGEPVGDSSQEKEDDDEDEEEESQVKTDESQV